MTRMTGSVCAVVGNLINTYLVQNRHRYAKAYLLEQGLEGNILVWQYSGLFYSEGWGGGRLPVISLPAYLL